MDLLTYSTVKKMSPQPYYLENAPERVLQFGAGNFLRGSMDYFIDVLNEKAGFNGKIAVVQSVTRGLSSLLNDQEGLYTFYRRGFMDGAPYHEKRIISSISRSINSTADFAEVLKTAENEHLRVIVSNTTEIGIQFNPSDKFNDSPPSTFPGKLTRLLFERYTLFGSVPGKGFIIIPSELLDDNGAELKNCVLKYVEAWGLCGGFETWLERENIFCSTLVDGIVSGYPEGEGEKLNAENGYRDELIVTAEPFSFWAVRAPESILEDLPFDKVGMPVKVVSDHSNYMQRKKRILNGTHTTIALAAHLAGKETVLDCMNDPIFSRYATDTIYNEILPTLTLPEKEAKDFADAVVERYKNPYIKHSVMAISLGSIGKWKERLLPSFKKYYENTGKLPRNITFSFAAMLAFYTGVRFEDGILTGVSNGKEYRINDIAPVLEFFYGIRSLPAREYVNAVMSNKDFWGENLTLYPGFARNAACILEDIRNRGVNSLLKERMQSNNA
ncbi:MAG: tagaturonate reductase [Christensenellales bacterium]|jgi:tagaturonate reductase